MNIKLILLTIKSIPLYSKADVKKDIQNTCLQRCILICPAGRKEKNCRYVSETKKTRSKVRQTKSRMPRRITKQKKVFSRKNREGNCLTHCRKNCMRKEELLQKTLEKKYGNTVCKNEPLYDEET